MIICAYVCQNISNSTKQYLARTQDHGHNNSIKQDLARIQDHDHNNSKKQDQFEMLVYHCQNKTTNTHNS